MLLDRGQSMIEADEDRTSLEDDILWEQGRFMLMTKFSESDIAGPDHMAGARAALCHVPASSYLRT